MCVAAVQTVLEVILKVTPLTAADRSQLSGTMTQDDGYGCRRGTSQTSRGEKGG